MNSKQPQTELSDEMLLAIENDLRAALEVVTDKNYPEFQKMIEYHLGWHSESTEVKGKRVRPLLTLLICGALGGKWQNALPAATAIELIHNFSLIHDDIEDRSELRRGQETVWKKWGTPRAINLGDALFVVGRLSSHRLSDRGIDLDTTLSVVETLDQACLQLTIGQDLDLIFETRDQVSEEEYLAMIDGKTAALIAAATAVGAIVAGADADKVRAVENIGESLGLAFQIQDDILGIWGLPNKTGKSAADDLQTRKKTLPIIYGLARSDEFVDLWQLPTSDEVTLEAMRSALQRAQALEDARALAEKFTQMAEESLQALEPDGPYTSELSSLLRKLLRRQH